MLGSKGKHKFGVGDLVKANDKAPGDYRGRIGRVVSRGPGRCEYGVQFDVDARGVGFLDSWCLDRLYRTPTPAGDSEQTLRVR